MVAETEIKKCFPAGKRLGMAKFEDFDNWYVGYSPRNSMDTTNFNGASVEGSWEDWVNLAKQIIEEDERRKQLGLSND